MTTWRRLPANHEALTWAAPEAPVADPAGLRPRRFGPEAQRLLAGQVGPLANLRSPAGISIGLVTDAPVIVLHLERLRHHQPVDQRLDLEVGNVGVVSSPDLRPHDGRLDLPLPTGLALGGPARSCLIHLPTISTLVVAGVSLPQAARAEPATAPAPRWLALGDSLLQGFNVASPTATWCAIASRTWGLPVRNLGVGGLMIEPELFAPALEQGPFDLVTIGLGSNHAWRPGDVDGAVDRAVRLATSALAGGHRQVAWFLPPWKPCEDGLGPPEFMGVPLDRAAAARVGILRAELRAALTSLGGVVLLDDLMPHDHRLLADGLHPNSLGAARYAERLVQGLTPAAA